MRLSERIYLATKSGRMKYKQWKLKRWADGFWHLYPPWSAACYDKVLGIQLAIKIIDNAEVKASNQ